MGVLIPLRSRVRARIETAARDELGHFFVSARERHRPRQRDQGEDAKNLHAWNVDLPGQG